MLVTNSTNRRGTKSRHLHVLATTSITRRGTNSRHLPAQRRCTVNTAKHLTQMRLLLLLALPDTTPYRHSNNQSPQPAYTKARRRARMLAFATRLQSAKESRSCVLPILWPDKVLWRHNGARARGHDRMHAFTQWRIITDTRCSKGAARATPARKR